MRRISQQDPNITKHTLTTAAHNTTISGFDLEGKSRLTYDDNSKPALKIVNHVKYFGKGSHGLVPIVNMKESG